MGKKNNTTTIYFDCLLFSYYYYTKIKVEKASYNESVLFYNVIPTHSPSPYPARSTPLIPSSCPNTPYHIKCQLCITISFGDINILHNYALLCSILSFLPLIGNAHADHLPKKSGPNNKL